MSQFNTKKINRYLDMAKEVSKQSNFKQHHLGAVVIYKGSLLASGCNSTKTSPIAWKYNRERDFDPNANGVVNSIHAEMAALNKIKYLDIDFSKVKLYIYREHKNGVKAIARPCPACRKMIRGMGIKEIWYTIENGFGYEYMEE